METESTVRRRGEADLGFVEGLHEALAELWVDAPRVPLADREMFALAVIEVATNIATHTPAASRPVRLDVALTAGSELRATLTDDAPRVHVDLDALSMADALSESGRGLALAAAVCDELSVDWDGGNVWRLRRSLGEAA